MAARAEIELGLSGFGRVGRSVLRYTFEEPNRRQVKAIVTRSPLKSYIPRLERDTKFPGRVLAKVEDINGTLVYNGYPILFETFTLGSDENQVLNWNEHHAGIVIETTGKIKNQRAAQCHLDNGAILVIVSCPPEPEDDMPMFVFGVNHKKYSPDMKVISSSSCTTSAVAPVLHALHTELKVRWAHVLSVHTFTSSQPLLDNANTGDEMRGISAIGGGIIPTSTSASRAVNLIIPDFIDVSFSASALRVPYAQVSCAEIIAEVKRPVTEEDILKKFEHWSKGEFTDVLQMGHVGATAAHFNGSRYPSIVDPRGIKVIDTNKVIIRVFYDNEDGYAGNLLRLADYAASRLGSVV